MTNERELHLRSAADILGDHTPEEWAEIWRAKESAYRRGFVHGAYEAHSCAPSRFDRWMDAIMRWRESGTKERWSRETPPPMAPRK